ncbi:S-adenosylmethionine--tRNA ribosyltransferase-isomerase [Natranaerovirga hydrolytica]|uniref:S-adenosylmethionine:tRNA ribosyltransferase-isomerase n=1 Tax=Natranaerovirga hydrolytica TaxID=680378 RepID=A0A4R1MSF3_9FIRM|nr:tRNA preQ1(34) S-adenosylmethionine ribosyltransferase-isomerase QueA [Natranaerovirga hydrolytica]TCK92853.1 S-adenosylmethionine--tRNA ribosyltransferase-isomerase [Natranaerovirga hydrolytica]
MKLEDFDFVLPEELIAQDPIKERSHSRMLVLDKETGQIEHKVFADIIDQLDPKDCLVLNNTKVMPARLIGEREKTQARIEFLLLNRLEGDEWEVMVKPGKKAKVNERVVFGEGILIAHIKEKLDNGNRLVKFEYEGIFEQVLDELGEMPLPPYITRKLEDKERYQTVYAKHIGSAAAPTAGLHFTNELLEKLKNKGIHIAYITLHVGIGTFRPVKVDNIEEHEMHSEHYWITKEEADKIKKAKENGGRIIPVGTTSCRTLETIMQEYGEIKESKGWTDIFMYPGYEFKIVDGLITNFHLPQSTLIMLVSALAEREKVMKAYQEAINKHYRFYSFGDAMFIK